MLKSRKLKLSFKKPIKHNSYYLLSQQQIWSYFIPTYFSSEVPVEMRGGKHVGQRAESMEQHGGELDDDDGPEEHQEHRPDRLQGQVVLSYGEL